MQQPGPSPPTKDVDVVHQMYAARAKDYLIFTIVTMIVFGIFGGFVGAIIAIPALLCSLMVSIV